MDMWGDCLYDVEKSEMKNMVVEKELAQRDFTGFLEEIYILGQEAIEMDTRDFIKIIEEKLHSLIEHQVINS
jgi:phosphosulfolactate synthase (CoM biosynthesis protein A)